MVDVRHAARAAPPRRRSRAPGAWCRRTGSCRWFAASWRTYFIASWYISQRLLEVDDVDLAPPPPRTSRSAGSSTAADHRPRPRGDRRLRRAVPRRHLQGRRPQCSRRSCRPRPTTRPAPTTSPRGRCSTASGARSSSPSATATRSPRAATAPSSTPRRPGPAAHDDRGRRPLRAGGPGRRVRRRRRRPHRRTDVTPAGSVRRAVRIERTAEDVWAFIGDPARLHEWFPGIVDADGRRHVPGDHHRHGAADARGDPHQRRDRPAVPVQARCCRW